MNIQEAKKIEMVSYLSKLGYEPHHYKPEHVAWYTSPFREENTASFNIDTKKNTWHDFGAGAGAIPGGDIVNFIQAFHKTDISNALKILDSKGFGKLSIHLAQKNVLVKETVSQIRINKELPITNQGLLNYLALRRIPIDLAAKYCKEIHYTCHNKNYIAIGFKNDSGGYELRSAYFKGKSCDAMTTISVPGNQELNLFEGFFDFLSALMHFNVSYPSNSTIITNSTNKTAVGNIDKLALIIKNFKVINLYFDNDSISMSGQKAASEIKKLHPNVHDLSRLYRGFKDFNEFIQNKY
jgi:hypothetical protein